MQSLHPIFSASNGELDTQKASWEAVKKVKFKLFFFLLISLGWSVSLIILLPTSFLNTDEGWFLIGLPYVLLGLWWAALYFKIRQAFWKELAVKYGWEYFSSKSVSKEKALLFHTGHSQKAWHCISGKYKNQPFSIFEYEYTLGHGKFTREYNFTVFEIKFSGTFPHLYLNYKGDWYSNKPALFSDIAEIPVPKEFQGKFKLYSPKEYEIETLQIFTPEIFSTLLDLEWSHDMEFIDGELVIYRNKTFNSFTQLDGELNKIKKFIDILAPRLNRLKLSQIGDISPHLK